MARVVFVPAARNDLRGLRAYIAQDSPAAAKAMAQRIRADAARLAQHPQMGRVVPEYANSSIRELIVAPYRVVYRYERERDLVQVLMVVHGSRLLPTLPEQP